MAGTLDSVWRGGSSNQKERLKGATADSLPEQVGNGAQLVLPPGMWTSYHVPNAATQATISKAAGGAGVRHVCTAITATIACGATVQTPIQIYLRDGATGTGTIIWAATVAAPANGQGGIAIDGLCIVGSADTAMTLEFSAAGVTSSQEVVSLAGISVS